MFGETQLGNPDSVDADSPNPAAAHGGRPENGLYPPNGHLNREHVDHPIDLGVFPQSFWRNPENHLLWHHAAGDGTAYGCRYRCSRRGPESSAMPSTRKDSPSEMQKKYPYRHFRVLFGSSDSKAHLGECDIGMGEYRGVSTTPKLFRNVHGDSIPLSN